MAYRLDRTRAFLWSSSGSRAFQQSSHSLKMPASSAPVPCVVPTTPELLVLAWGFFFISQSSEREPTLKARNFTKSLKLASSSVNSKMKKRRRGQPNADADHEQEQEWGAGGGDRHMARANESGASEEVSPETGASTSKGYEPFSGRKIMSAVRMDAQAYTLRLELVLRPQWVRSGR